MKWQNLIYKKCPNCDTPMRDVGSWMRCPHVQADGKQCFAISFVNAAKLLLDPNHSANKFLPYDERKNVIKIIQNWGQQVKKEKVDEKELEIALNNLNFA